MSGRSAASVSRTTGPRAVVLHVRGELDALVLPEFRSALEAAVAETAPVVVVDLEHATFLDSSCLSVVFAARRALPPGRDLVLGNVPARMMRTLRLAAVVRVVDAYPLGEPQPWRDDEDEPGRP